jgi:hypothetical protein
MARHSDKQQFITTTSPSELEFAMRFLTGCCAQIGERRVKRDAATTVWQILALQNLFQHKYDDTKERDNEVDLQKTCKIAIFFLLSFCCSMRGFELPKIVLHTLCITCQFQESINTLAHLRVPS